MGQTRSDLICALRTVHHGKSLKLCQSYVCSQNVYFNVRWLQLIKVSSIVSSCAWKKFFNTVLYWVLSDGYINVTVQDWKVWVGSKINSNIQIKILLIIMKILSQFCFWMQTWNSDTLLIDQVLINEGRG